MKIIKYLLLLLLIVAIGLGIYVATQPSAYEVTRTRVLKAPLDVVYGNVSDYKNWEAWGPWKETDPTMTFSYPEKTSGVGAAYSWSGKDGDGSMKMVAAETNSSITNELDFGGMGKAEGFWKFKPAAEGTEVTWGIKAEDTPFIFKFFSAISGGYDAMMGPMFERGLVKLDSITEIQAKELAAAEAAAKAWTMGDITKKPLPAQKFIGYPHKSKIDMEAMTKLFMESMPKAGAYAAQSGLQPNEYVPGAVYTSWDEKTGVSEFLIGLFLKKTIKPGPGMKTIDLAAGEVVMVSKYGNYGTGDEMAHGAINKFIQENNLTINGPTYEMYVNDPTLVKPNEIQTDIYYPVK